MDQQQSLAVYQAQVENVSAMRSAMSQVRKGINDAIRRKDESSTNSQTKIYALLFCGWAEANFIKVLHTPHGFELDEVDQVKRDKSENGIVSAWNKSILLGLRHLDAKRGNFSPNAKRRLERAVLDHIHDPVVMRNKLAHGQWIVALNRNSDNINLELTEKIANLNIIVVDTWIKAHELLADAVLNLIISPKKAFVQNWYKFVTDLETHLAEAENRTFAEHKARIMKKPKSRAAPARL